ncbi:hypothetical protein O181_080091 [Austropuccinia psidii MF-1]|uniref:Integrase catalytic domain-containing protein n=1 Tax=Austropuccinia psidii MF-1 TaxID=1389203 RepID=A0A9Q3FHJ4_9BASI|nr:hypothetical protein [Austropuccinia psidii MF-1]
MGPALQNKNVQNKLDQLSNSENSNSERFQSLNSSPTNKMENPSSTLSEVKNIDKLSSTNYFSWKRSMVAALGMRNLEGLLEKDLLKEKNDECIKRQRQIVYFFIIGHLDAENYEKFDVDENRNPASLWNSIKEHYASTSSENIATHFAKLFSIKSSSSFAGLSEAISHFRSTLKLLHSLSPQLFSANIMPQVLAFYILRMLPETCRHVSAAIFHSIKASTKIPTVEEVFKEVELDIIQRVDMDEEENLALKVARCNNKEFGVALAVCNLTSGIPVLYSGTSNTIAPGQSSFVKTWPTAEQLQAANGSEIKVKAEGVIHVRTRKGDLIIKDSLLVPSATSTLVARGPFLQKGAVLRGHPGGADLFDRDGKLISETQLVKNILVIKSSPSNSVNAISSSDSLLIHRKIGHPGNDLALRMVPGVDFSLLDYTSCSISKAHRLPFQGKLPDALFPLDVIHMDVCGPITLANHAGNNKSDCLESFVSLKRLVENQPQKKIRAVVSDNGGKFVDSRFTNLFKKFGIDHLLTEPFTPKQNPIVERGNRKLLEKIRVPLAGYQVLTDWWGEACSMATYLLNRAPVLTIGFQAPICFWPTHSSFSKPSPHLSFADYLLCSTNPTVKPILSFSDVSAVPMLINKEEPVSDIVEKPPQASSSECSLINELAGDPVEGVSGISSSGMTLPKGWVYDKVPYKAPQDISGAVSPKNIIEGGCVRRPPACFSGAVLNEEPRSFSNAMASSKATAWLAAIGKEFESLGRNQVIEEVTLTSTMRLLDTTWVLNL